MSSPVVFLNFIAAIASIIAEFYVVSRDGSYIFLLLLYFGPLGLPGLVANTVLLGLLPGFRVVALAIHAFAIVVLVAFFVLACLLSLASGGAAFPFVFVAILVNWTSLMALRRMPSLKKEES